MTDMAGPSNADIYERLGSLTAKIDGMRSDFANSQDEAHDHRKRVYERFEELAVSTADMEQRIERMEPAVAVFTSLRAKAGGAIFMLSIIGAIIGALATYFADAVKAFLARLFS